MAVVKELIRKESNGSISFGNYELPQKTKLADFEVAGDLYKVKTFKDITKLERNESFVYESIPGTAVSIFKETAEKISFFVDGIGPTQITLELEPNQSYKVVVGENDLGVSKTDIGGKLTFDVNLEKGSLKQITITAE